VGGGGAKSGEADHRYGAALSGAARATGALFQRSGMDIQGFATVTASLIEKGCTRRGRPTRRYEQLVELPRWVKSAESARGHSP
jgi:hypothetical protein